MSEHPGYKCNTCNALLAREGVVFITHDVYACWKSPHWVHWRKCSTHGAMTVPTDSLYYFQRTAFATINQQNPVNT